MVGPTGDFAPMCRKCGSMMPFSYGPYGLCDECRRKMSSKADDKKKSSDTELKICMTCGKQYYGTSCMQCLVKWHEDNKLF